jgi:hypothetical protein
MRVPNKRRKRTRAEQKERRQRNATPPLSRFEMPFVPASDESYADNWTAATRQNIVALCGDDVDGEEILALANAILVRNIDPNDRPAIGAVAAGWNRPNTAPQHWARLVEAAIMTAADPVFLAANGPDAPWRQGDHTIPEGPQSTPVPAELDQLSSAELETLVARLREKKAQLLDEQVQLLDRLAGRRRKASP